MEDDPNHELHDLGSNPKSPGIYPGRCGDTSPHKGVLNIPLGAKVTSHAVGTALINLVSPKVESFAPDLIIISAGFDAHKSDPMGLGGLRAEDFGHITQVICQMAFKSCSGRVLSVLEGGYGVPCCRPQKGIFLPENATLISQTIVKPSTDPLPMSTESTGSAALDAPQKAESNNASPDSAPKEQLNGGGGSIPSVRQNGGGETTAAKDDEPANKASEPASTSADAGATDPPKQRPQPSKLLELGDDLPDDMDDQVPYALQFRLEKCHAEGFVECVFEHMQSLVRCNKLGP